MTRKLTGWCRLGEMNARGRKKINSLVAYNNNDGMRPLEIAMGGTSAAAAKKRLMLSTMSLSAPAYSWAYLLTYILSSTLPLIKWYLTARAAGVDTSLYHTRFQVQQFSSTPLSSLSLRLSLWISLHNAFASQNVIRFNTSSHAISAILIALAGF